MTTCHHQLRLVLNKSGMAHPGSKLREAGVLFWVTPGLHVTKLLGWSLLEGSTILPAAWHIGAAGHCPAELWCMMKSGQAQLWWERERLYALSHGSAALLCSAAVRLV